jgi:hypothetical protein
MRTQMKRLGCLILLLSLFSGTHAVAEEVAVFSRTYVREAGGPNEWTDVVVLPQGVGTPFKLRIQNGTEAGAHRVSSATVEVDGTSILQQQDLHQYVASVERLVEVAEGTTRLTVRLTSNPGGRLSLTLFGTASAPGPAPLPPPSITVGTTDHSASLTWASSPSEDVAAYRIYRGVHPDDLKLLATVPASGRGGDDFTDKQPHFDVPSFYVLTAVNRLGVESARSVLLPAFVKPLQSQQRYTKVNKHLNAFLEVAPLLTNSQLVDAADVMQVGLLPGEPLMLDLNVVTSFDQVPEVILESLRADGYIVDAVTWGPIIFVQAPLSRIQEFMNLEFVRGVDAPAYIGMPNQVAPTPTSGGELHKKIYELLGIDFYHNRGVKGAGIKIAVVEREGSEHATRVKFAAQDAAPEASVEVLDYSSARSRHGGPPAAASVREAIRLGYDIVNISQGFGASAIAAKKFHEALREGLPDGTPHDQARIVCTISSGNSSMLHSFTPMSEHTEEGYALIGGVDYIKIQANHPSFSLTGKKIRVSVFSTVNSLTSVSFIVEDEDGEQKYQFDSGVAEALAESWIEWKDEYRIRIPMGPKGPDGKIQIKNLNRPVHIDMHLGEGTPFNAFQVNAPVTEFSITGDAAVPSAITVGSSRNTSVTPPAPDAVSYYSRTGPAYLPAPTSDVDLPPFGITDIPKPDIVAPGALDDPSGEGTAHGTSFAAPRVAAAAALLMVGYRRDNQNTATTPQEVKFIRDLLQREALPLRLPGQAPEQFVTRPQSDYGWGRLNLPEDRAWLLNGSSISLRRGNGQLVALFSSGGSPGPLAMDPEPRSEGVWVMDEFHNVVRRFSPKGATWFLNRNHPELAQTQPDAIACDLETGSTILAVAGKSDYLTTKLVRLRYSLQMVNGQEVGVITHEIASPQDLTDLFFISLGADPNSSALWGIAAVRNAATSRLQARIWRGEDDGTSISGSALQTFTADSTRYMGRGFGIDPLDGSIWFGNKGTLYNMSSDGLGMSQYELGNQVADFIKDVSIDPVGGGVWVTHVHGWVKYVVDKDMGTIQAVYSKDALNPYYLAEYVTRRGRVSPVKGSVWALDDDGYSYYLRHWDALGQQGFEDRKIPGILYGGLPPAAPSMGLLDTRDPNAAPTPEPTPIVVAALASPLPAAPAPVGETASFWLENPGLAALADAAEADGLSIEEWADSSIERRVQFVEAVRAAREGRFPQE